MDGFKWSGFENFVPLYGSVGNVANNVNTFSDLMALKDAGGVDVLKDTPVLGPAINEFGEKVIETAEGVNQGKTKLEEKYNYQTRVNNRSGFRVRDGGQVWMRTDKFDFRTLIQMMRERSNTKILASPMLVVGDHSQAAIQVSNIDPIPQIDASSLAGFASNGGVQETLNIQWNMLRSGILMWVAPEITESGSSVRMTVHPQVTTKGNIVDLGELGGKFSEYPIYNYELKQHEMDTRATVPSGATLMFGGLIDNVEEEVETKVRWLADIPLVGWFFRSKTKQLVQKNLVIMIRPTILEDSDLTGFETNALKETKSVMVNSGRDLKKTPIGGPYSVKEIKKKTENLIDERVLKPFRDEKKPVEKKPEAKPADEAAPAKDGDKKDEKPSEVK
jgi:type II secretory pathway component GspD/PulD (secretin)